MLKSKSYIEKWNSQNAGPATEFLKAQYATSMFLLGNLADQGPNLADHPNSGNFKVLSFENEVVGVFCLTRRGNILLSAKTGIDFNEIILAECVAERIPI